MLLGLCVLSLYVREFTVCARLELGDDADDNNQQRGAKQKKTSTNYRETDTNSANVWATSTAATMTTTSTSHCVHNILVAAGVRTHYYHHSHQLTRARGGGMLILSCVPCARKSVCDFTVSTSVCACRVSHPRRRRRRRRRRSRPNDVKKRGVATRAIEECAPLTRRRPRCLCICCCY